MTLSKPMVKKISSSTDIRKGVFWNPCFSRNCRVIYRQIDRGIDAFQRNLCYVQSFIVREAHIVDPKTKYWLIENGLEYTLVKVSCQNLEWSRLSDVINRGKIRKIKLKKAKIFNLILRIEDATLSKIGDHNLERQSFLLSNATVQKLIISFHYRDNRR